MEYIIEYIMELTDRLYFKSFNEEEKNEEPLVSAKYVYSHGGCYELAKMLNQLVPESEIYINQKNNHCAVLYDGFLYDANGLVKEDVNQYHLANEQEIQFMEREFGKYFQILRLYQTIAPKIVMVGSDQIIRTQIHKDTMSNSRTVSHR